eukprot:gene513-1162_t
MEDVEDLLLPHKKRRVDNEKETFNDDKTSEFNSALPAISVESSELASNETKIEEQLHQHEHVVPRPNSENNDNVDIRPENSPINGESKLREPDVGIREYISTFAGVPGILKQRYSDFVVRERDLNGELVYLDKNKIVDETANVACEDEREDGDEAEIACPLVDEDVSRISEFASKKGASECDASGGNDGVARNASLVLSADNDKQHRTLVHQYIRKKYDALDTDVVDVDSSGKAIRVFYKSKANKKRRWNSSGEKKNQRYSHFVLYKENRDTMSAVNKIAEVLRVRPSIFSYAGTKDKRAVTIQQVCASRIDAKRLLSVNRRVKQLSLGSVCYKDSPLKLGDLTGNHFVIILREIPSETEKEHVENVMSSLRKTGFINYFGMQRFGSGSVPTYEIGKTVLQSDWSKTVDLIMTPREGEEMSILQAKKHWHDSKDSKEAAKFLNRRRCIEGQVLETLAKLGENAHYNAFQNIPRNTRLLYLHSYQSYVWNRVVSERIAKYGLKVLPGDLVVIEDDQTSKQLDDSKDTKHSLTRCKVKHVDQDEMATHSITDIVMPLPGYDMLYPDNALRDVYTKIMADDGLTLADMKHKIKDYSLSGAYRYIVVKPENVDWNIVYYDDYCIPLIQTEVDNNMSCAEGAQPLQLDNTTGKFASLKVEFTLPPSSYATMVIREITKLDSSANYQSTLNQTT